MNHFHSWRECRLIDSRTAWWEPVSKGSNARIRSGACTSVIVAYSTWSGQAAGVNEYNPPSRPGTGVYCITSAYAYQSSPVGNTLDTGWADLISDLIGKGANSSAHLQCSMPGNPQRTIRRIADLVGWHTELAAEFDKALPHIYRFNGVADTGDARRDAWACADRDIINAGIALRELERVLRAAAMQRAKPRGKPSTYVKVEADNGQPTSTAT